MKKEDRIGVQFGEEVSGKTIVGGRGTVRKPQPVPVPVGIEKVLYVAASDPAFKAKLLTRREEAVSEPRFGLNSTEREILSGVPPEQLSMMIERIDPVEHGRRKFIRKVAVAALGLAAVSVDVACGYSTGSSPDYPDRDSHPDASTKTDASTICSDVHPCPDAGGSRPDRDAGDGGDAAIEEPDEDPQDARVSTDVSPCCDGGGARPDVGPGGDTIEDAGSEDGAAEPDGETAAGDGGPENDAEETDAESGEGDEEPEAGGDI